MEDEHFDFALHEQSPHVVLDAEKISNKNLHKRNSIPPAVEYTQYTCSLCH